MERKGETEDKSIELISKNDAMKVELIQLSHPYFTVEELSINSHYDLSWHALCIEVFVPFYPFCY